jgi:omega-6 fatty acid desaturase (delta-12 desaturase)
MDPKENLRITVGEIRKAIPEHLFKKDEMRFLVSVGYSVSFTLILMYLGRMYIPLTFWMIPVWILNAAVVGTVLGGVWVLGHECGHQAFSNSALLNDTLGYILHTAVLVPYFSWQHSHAIHHAKTNHLTEGESHCPSLTTTAMGKFYLRMREIMGNESFAIFHIFNLSLLGFPLYMLIGASGGSARGFTSHFLVPNKLFP